MQEHIICLRMFLILTLLILVLLHLALTAKNKTSLLIEFLFN